MFKCGLVLEGGGSRGVYTAGVLDAFIEEGIEFPYVIGVSMGSCCGASYLGKNKGRIHDLQINYINDKRYMSFSNFIRNGEFMNGDWIFDELSYDILPLNHENFESSNACFCVVATNALTGKAEYFYPKSLRERGCTEVRASCSIPAATKGVQIGKDIYFDGGVADSIPLKRAFEDGCEKAVVILTQDKTFVKPPFSPTLAKRLKKYPKIQEDMLNRHNVYMEQRAYVDEAKENGTAYVIQPLTPLDCSTLERSTAKLEAIYQLGYTQGHKIANEVKEYIK